MISQVESFLCPDKHGTPEEAGGYSGWNVVEITIKMKTIVWKFLLIKKKNRVYSFKYSSLIQKISIKFIVSKRSYLKFNKPNQVRVLHSHIYIHNTWGI